MTTHALADACAALGHPIPRSVLANLESGRRETITVPELYVLALALRVSPLMLLLPLGYADTIEAAPGVHVPTTEAMRWLRGERWLLEPLPADAEWDSAVTGFLVHQQSVERWERARHYARAIRSGEMEGAALDAEQHDHDAELAAETLRGMRRLMRDQGLNPPPLPPELGFVEEARPS